MLQKYVLFSLLLALPSVLQAQVAPSSSLESQPRAPVISQPSDASVYIEGEALPDDVLDGPLSQLESVLLEIYPASPNEIREMLRRLEEVERAKREPLAAVKTRTRSLTIDVQPGMAAAPVVTSRGYSTVVSFFDQSSAPWPIDFFSLGNAEGFDIEHPAAHMLSVTPKQRYVQSNLLIKLDGMDVPVDFSLQYQKELADSVVSITVSGLSPIAQEGMDRGYENALMARQKEGDGLIPAEVLDAFLDDVPQEGAWALPRSGDGSTAAWIFSNKMVVRSSHKVISPKSRQVQASASGVRVYVLTSVSPVVSLFENGNTRFVTAAVRAEDMRLVDSNLAQNDRRLPE